MQEISSQLDGVWLSYKPEVNIQSRAGGGGGGHPGY